MLISLFRWKGTATVPLYINAMNGISSLTAITVSEVRLVAARTDVTGETNVPIKTCALLLLSLVYALVSSCKCKSKWANRELGAQNSCLLLLLFTVCCCCYRDGITLHVSHSLSILCMLHVYCNTGSTPLLTYYLTLFALALVILLFLF